MDEVTRNKLMNVLFDDMYGCFELRDYILYGGNFPGLRNMTDEELIAEYEAYTEDNDELLAECRAAMAIKEMLE